MHFEQDCSICLEDVRVDNRIELKCKHCFCTECFKLVFDENMKFESIMSLKCPTCRQAVDDPDVLPSEWFCTQNAPTLQMLRKIEHRLDTQTSKEIFPSVIETYRCSIVRKAIRFSIRMNKLDMLAWWIDKIKFESGMFMCNAAIEYDNIDALKLVLAPEHGMESNLNVLRDQFFVYLQNKFVDVSLPIFEFIYSKSIVVWANEYNIATHLAEVDSIEKLNWWRERLPLIPFSNVLYNDDLNLLNWWSENMNELFLKADVGAIVDNLKTVEALQWWKAKCEEELIEFAYSNSAITGALMNHNMKVLEWWSATGLPLKMNERDCFQYADSVETLDWIVKHLPLNAKEFLPSFLGDIMWRCCTFDTKDDIPKVDRKSIMSWCIEHCPVSARHSTFLNVANLCLQNLSHNGWVDKLDWWIESDMPIRYNNDAVDLASQNGHLQVLKWWKKSGFEMLYSCAALTGAVLNGHIEVVNWWKKESGLPLKIDLQDDKINESYYHNILKDEFESRYTDYDSSDSEDDEQKQKRFKRTRELCEDLIQY